MSKKTDYEAGLLQNGGMGTAGQLMMMRMLLKQQTAPVLQTGAVQDIGQGINQAGTDIANLMLHHKQQQADQQQLDTFMAQEQKAREAVAAQAQAETHQQNVGDQYNAGIAGVPLESWQGADKTLQNTMLSAGMKQNDENARAESLQGLFSTPVSANNPNFMDLGYAPSMLSSDVAHMAINDPTTLSKLSQLATAPQRAQMASPLLQAYSPDTFGGSNMLKALDVPHTTGHEWNKGKFDAAGAGFNALSAQQGARYSGAEHRQGLVNSQVGNVGTMAGVNHTNAETPYVGALAQNTLNNGSINFAQNKFNLDRGVTGYNQGQQYAQGIGDPYGRITAQTELGGMGNPFAAGQAQGNIVAGVAAGKEAKKNAARIKTYQQSLPKPPVFQQPTQQPHPSATPGASISAAHPQPASTVPTLRAANGTVQQQQEHMAWLDNLSRLHNAIFGGGSLLGR